MRGARLDPVALEHVLREINESLRADRTFACFCYKSPEKANSGLTPAASVFERKRRMFTELDYLSFAPQPSSLTLPSESTSANHSLELPRSRSSMARAASATHPSRLNSVPNVSIDSSAVTTSAPVVNGPREFIVRSMSSLRDLSREQLPPGVAVAAAAAAAHMNAVQNTLEQTAAAVTGLGLINTTYSNSRLDLRRSSRSSGHLVHSREIPDLSRAGSQENAAIQGEQAVNEESNDTTNNAASTFQPTTLPATHFVNAMKCNSSDCPYHGPCQVERVMRTVDYIYHATFYDYVRDECNMYVTARHIHSMIQEFTLHQIACTLCWLVSDWTNEATAEILGIVTAKWPPELVGHLMRLMLALPQYILDSRKNLYPNETLSDLSLIQEEYAFMRTKSTRDVYDIATIMLVDASPEDAAAFVFALTSQVHASPKDETLSLAPCLVFSNVSEIMRYGRDSVQDSKPQWSSSFNITWDIEAITQMISHLDTQLEWDDSYFSDFTQNYIQLVKDYQLRRGFSTPTKQSVSQLGSRRNSKELGQESSGTQITPDENSLRHAHTRERSASTWRQAWRRRGRLHLRPSVYYYADEASTAGATSEDEQQAQEMAHQEMELHHFYGDDENDESDEQLYSDYALDMPEGWRTDHNEELEAIEDASEEENETDSMPLDRTQEFERAMRRHERLMAHLDRLVENMQDLEDDAELRETAQRIASEQVQLRQMLQECSAAAEEVRAQMEAQRTAATTESTLAPVRPPSVRANPLLTRSENILPCRSAQNLPSPKPDLDISMPSRSSSSVLSLPKLVHPELEAPSSSNASEAHHIVTLPRLPVLTEPVAIRALSGNEVNDENESFRRIYEAGLNVTTPSVAAAAYRVVHSQQQLRQNSQALQRCSEGESALESNVDSPPQQQQRVMARPRSHSLQRRR